jgi:hypothetical protein
MSGQGQRPISFNIQDMFQLGHHLRLDPKHLFVGSTKAQMPPGISAHMSTLLTQIMLTFTNHGCS